MRVQNGRYHLISSAYNNFKRNKARTVLTSLGIMIGVLSVVVLTALGVGLKNYLSDTFENLGSNIVIIMSGGGVGGEGAGFAGAFVAGADFDENDVRSLQKLSDIEYISPLFIKQTLVETSTNEEYIYLRGTNTQVFGLLNTNLLAGEYFSDSDIQSRAKVGVLGQRAAENLFGDYESAIGKTVRFDNQRFKIIGVYENIGAREIDNNIMIPYKTTYGSMNPKKTFRAIFLGVADEDNVELVKGKAEEILLKRYEKDDFSVTDQSELLSTISEIFSMVNGVLIAIASISLLVGGIGIMNIMYASVTERIKEVGIRRAVGATQRDILMQFLTESVLLSVFGGLLGLLFAVIIVLIVRSFFPVAIDLFSVIITLVISSGIGIFFGVFPARRASKLPPISAIRYG